ncbi:probable myosin-binding protein 6 [Salvia splendens]|uniref:probable myosin-binding protein 6 n=1 Tax=Salvia splendens TaxID=180675 RepID=UPI001C26C247|nr:probable myosin-binding protein 6 [Salvia splendens]XP_041997862.1 probable myosin-binding protein 6 [Salvia splendens]XP_041997863.1 probable myosin-binding protein 6 [Salvia splendens]
MPNELLKWLWEQPLASFPNSLHNSIVQCFMIVLLFVDRLLSFVSTEFARLFGLHLPCLLCPHNPADLYYNESICDAHKRNVSSLGFCAVHSKLSDIRSMCHVCIVSFATEKDSDCDKYKAVAAILNKDIDRIVDDDRRAALLRRLKKDDDDKGGDPNLWCSCCGEPLKLRASKKFLRSLSTKSPASSPRLSWLPNRNDETPRSRYLELEAPQNDAITPFLQDDPNRTPKWLMSWSSKKLNFDKVDTPVEPLDIMKPLNEVDSDVLSRLKQQGNLDQDSLMALYVELDNERSVAAVAANNAMAMITRIQQEKAAIQMEALQYQRMMEEQAEYDEEALDLMRDMLITKEDDVKTLESELEAYRVKYGPIGKYGSDICEFDADEDSMEMKSQSSCLSEKLSDYHSF